MPSCSLLLFNNTPELCLLPQGDLKYTRQHLVLAVTEQELNPKKDSEIVVTYLIKF